VQIRVNSDKNIPVDTKVIHFIEGEVSRGLKRYAGRLTRVEVHLSDVGKLGKQYEDTSVTPMGLRRSPANGDASSTGPAAGGIDRANAPSAKRSSVAAKKRAPGATSATRVASTKKAIYQARRKSWPAR
jgi:hypothetical protein